MTRTARGRNIHGGTPEIRMRRIYADRADAGRTLAESLSAWRSAPDTMVLALPRGGVPVAYEVATALALPLDVLVVRKLGLPSQPELAMGAIASGGALVLNRDVLRYLRGGDDALESVRARETAELVRRERQYRGDQPPLEMSGRTAIVVDDGLATGATMEAAVRALGSLGAKRIIVAVPVASGEARERVAAVADEVVCPYTPEFFSAVGQWYRDFDQTSDDEVRALLERAHATLALPAGRGGGDS
jgi:putative phosphoribosyl transferase